MPDNFEWVVETYGDMLFRISLTLLADTYDAEDAVQETFCRYVAKAHHFTGDEHRKAWLIRVCINICKDMLRRRVRDVHLSLDDLTDYGISNTEIADILQITPSAVKKRLQFAREKLRIQLDEVETTKVDEDAGELSQADRG